MRNGLLPFALSALVSGCAMPGRGQDPAAELAAAPESVEFAGRSYRLEAELWRDFQPVAPPDGQPLIAVVRVVAEDGQPLPEELVITRAWVRYRDELWSPPEPDEPPGPMLHLADGPKWGPGVNVEVVARVRLGPEAGLLRVADRPILRTD